MKVAVIIPARNEAANLGPLLADLWRQRPDRVIVVDNGSRDGTAAVAARAGALVVSEPRAGYGYACAAGVRAAGDADVLVFLDGDRSFDPADLPALLAPLQAGRADLVLGSRLRGGLAPGAMPPHQAFGNWLVARLVRLGYGVRITDLGPYRAVRRDLVLRLGMREMTYGWPVEMIVKAARRRAHIVEVPVRSYPRAAGRSKVAGTLPGTLLATWRILAVTLRYLRAPRA